MRQHRKTGLRVIVGLSALIAAHSVVAAATFRNEQSVESRPIGEPIMAIISLRDQQITVYDNQGWILRATVSSGQKGRETPAGTFTVLQKEAEHYSNMYDDAYMPHMQRLTWSGIALHGGPLPGYPASHGCIRMPYDFAERLFDATKIGMRVIVAASNVAPVTINHPALFQPKSGPADKAAAAAAAEADKAVGEADRARAVVMTGARESALAIAAVRKIEILKVKAEAQLVAAERAIAAAVSVEAKEQADEAKAKAVSQIDEFETQLRSAKTELQRKLDASAAARAIATVAETARVTASAAARKAARDLEPISVFVSRKTQRLYIRQAFAPIVEIPITIQDADRPIGTHIFTAMERTGNDMRWSVVSMLSGQAEIVGDEPNGSARKTRGSDVAAILTDVSAAKAALDRIAIPQDTLDRIVEAVSPHSSLIVSDEALSAETGNGTEFVVIMSNEPQGGLKHRRRNPQIDARYDRPAYWRSPFMGQYSTRWPRY
jgi:hypothetical protein